MDAVNIEKREERLTLQLTQSELYMISRKAKALGMSRPNMIVNAVIDYECECGQTSKPDQNKVMEVLLGLPIPDSVKLCKSCKRAHG